MCRTMRGRRGVRLGCTLASLWMKQWKESVRDETGLCELGCSFSHNCLSRDICDAFLSSFASEVFAFLNSARV